MYQANQPQGLELTRSSALLNHNELRALWTMQLTHEQESLDREYQSRHPLEIALDSKVFHPKDATGSFKKSA